MHIIKMLVSTKNITMTLPRLDLTRLKRGHSAHRSGAGVHYDRRTNRLRTRSAKRRAALTQE